MKNIKNCFILFSEATIFPRRATPLPPAASAAARTASYMMQAFRGPARYFPEQTKAQFSRQKESAGNIVANNANNEADIHTAMARNEEEQWHAGSAEEDIERETYVWLFVTMFVVAFVLVLLIALSIQLISRATQRSKQV